MIKHIPTADEFRRIGLSLLNLAWDGAASLLKDLHEAKIFDTGAAKAEPEYWAAARLSLATSLATVQQGAEFLLKSKIAAISPYLLLSGPPKEWPTGCDKGDAQFGEFRTIDAQDLVRVHDTFAQVRLPSEFLVSFEGLRRKRNAIMHTVDPRISVHVEELVLEILSIHRHLCTGENWIETRRRYLKESPISRLSHGYPIESLIVWEFCLVSELLRPQAMQLYFGFNKRQRRYICPACEGEAAEMQLSPTTAILRPNLPTSTTLWCFVCDKKQEVVRKDCPDPDCPGNVISTDHGICTTCGGSAVALARLFSASP